MENKEKNTRTIKLSESSINVFQGAVMARLAEKAYKSYQYRWLSEREISLEDLAEEMSYTNTRYMQENDGEQLTTEEQLSTVIEEGIDGEIFVSFDEFKHNEFLDKNIIRNLLNENDFKEYSEILPKLKDELGLKQDETVRVVCHDAEIYISKLPPEKAEFINESLESIKASPLYVCSKVEADGRESDSYLVSCGKDRTFNSHLITKNGLEWGHYDVGSKSKALNQSIARAGGTELSNIDFQDLSNDELRAKISELEKANKRIAGKNEKLISEDRRPFSSSENAPVFEEIYVSDKERRVALRFIPELQFNEENGRNDIPHVTVVSENTITGRRFTDAMFRETVSYESFLGSGFIDSFVKKTSEKYGITERRFEKISESDFKTMSEKVKKVSPYEDQSVFERFFRRSQAVIFASGLESCTANVDKILKLASDALNCFGKEEKKEIKESFKVFRFGEKQYPNEKKSLAYFLSDTDISQYLSEKQRSLSERRSERKRETEISRS